MADIITLLLMLNNNWTVLCSL